MTEIVAQSVFQGGSGLPEDRFVNTWQFSGSGSYGSSATLVAGRLIDFYNEATFPNLPLGGYMSGWIMREESEIRVYNLDDAEPREPFIVPFTLAAATDNTAFPEEVALCLSYHGVAPITPRRRGRVYLGPFNFDAWEPAPQPSRPSASMTATILAAAADLAGLSDLALRWIVRSSFEPEGGVTITGGWVDNAWDTQRRRGPGASARTTFGT